MQIIKKTNMIQKFRTQKVINKTEKKQKNTKELKTENISTQKKGKHKKP